MHHVQESEDLVLPPDVSLKGVRTLLQTPSKGHFYVIGVRSPVKWQGPPGQDTKKIGPAAFLVHKL